MGTSKDVAALSAKCAAAAKAIEKARKEAVKKAAQSLRADVEQSRNKAVGGDGRMSGVGKKGAKLGVQLKAVGPVDQRLKASGPWPLIENNTPAHAIKPKKRKAIVIGGGIVRANAKHPGTKGKQPWRKGIDAGRPEAVKILRKQTTDAAFGVFKGVAS